ncbi:MAG: hypothetical protein M9951_15565 [Burkholderiaceae bacterium]|jgi:hypothetical protein|nr:hypothetical protein [Burkholderiaceae bacterium]
MFTARTYFLQAALPAFHEMVDRRRSRTTGEGIDLRAVGAAADALLNLPDHLFRNDPQIREVAAFRSIKDYRESHWPRCPAYELTCDIANSFKHRELTRQGKTINSKYDLVEACAICEFNDSNGAYYYAIPYVLASTIDQGKCLVQRAIYNAMAYWNSELVRLGVIPKLVQLNYSELVLRDDPAFADEFKIYGMAGEYMQIQNLVLIYNHQTLLLESPKPGRRINVTVPIKCEIRPSVFDA